jgi:ureidoglycolate lyase
LGSIAIEDLPFVPEGVRLGPCVSRVGKFVCLGLNYRDHVRETGATAPSEPILFMNASSSITGPHDVILIPPGASMVDWGVELGVNIRSKAKLGIEGLGEQSQFVTAA